MMESKVSISFREELMGDENGSESFYVKVTPKVKIQTVVKPEDIMYEAIKAIRKELKKKGMGK